MRMRTAAGEGTEQLTDDDRSPEALAFLAALGALCEEHGYLIGHEDGHGNFEIVRADVARWTSPDWIAAATEVR